MEQLATPLEKKEASLGLILVAKLGWDIENSVRAVMNIEL